MVGFRGEGRELLNTLPLAREADFPVRPNSETRASIDIAVRRIIEVELMEEAAELGRLTLFSVRHV